MIPWVAMAIHKGLWGIALLVAIVVPRSLDAGTVVIPHTFINGQVADAADVNGNFTALAGAVNDNDGRLAALETIVASLQADLTTAQSEITMLRTDFDAAQSEIMTLQTNLSNIQALNDYVSVEMNTLDGLTGPHVFYRCQCSHP